MQLLVIKLDSLTAIPNYALLGKKQSQDRFTPSNWKKVSSLTRGRKILLLVPNDEVVLSTLNIPSKNKKQLNRAVPFALEDSLADDLENLHFAIHQDGSDEDTQVAVISKQKLSQYIGLLKEHNITAYAVLPQVLAQNHENESWSVLQNINSQESDLTNSVADENNISVRVNKFSGFSSSKNLLGLFLAEQFETKPIKTIHTNIEQEAFSGDLHELKFKTLDVNEVDYKSATSALGLNLLTNYIQQGTSNSSVNWKAWRPALVLAGLLATTWIGILGWQNTQLQQQREQLTNAVNQTFLDAFPNSRVVDASQQMRSKLAALQKQTGKSIESPIPLIADIGPLLNEFKDINLNEVNYTNGELTLMLKTPSLNRLEAFKKAAKDKAELNVKIKDSNTTADKVEAKVIISPLSAQTKSFSKVNKV